MAAKRAAYLLITFVFIAMIGTAIFLNDIIPGSESSMSITGNVVSESASVLGSGMSGFFLIILIIAVITIYLVLINKRRNIFDKIKPEQYTGFILRLTLGAALLVMAIQNDQGLIFISIFEAILGILLVLGIFVRQLSFISAVFFIYLIFMTKQNLPGIYGSEIFTIILLLCLSIATLFAGSGPFGIPIKQIK